jgi:hypothetical protein
MTKKRGHRPLFLIDLYFDDRVDWAYDFACSAVDANIFIDDVDVAFADAVDGAFRDAGRASDAIFGDSSWHGDFLLRELCIIYIVVHPPRKVNIFLE